MKKSLKTSGIIMLAIAFVMTSCKKNNDTAPDSNSTGNPAPTASSAPAPVTSQPADADGVCVATKINVTTSIPGTTLVITSTIGSAVASFYTAPGATTLSDAGVVKTNDSLHTKQSNNSYSFSPKSASGINFGNSSIWNISGNSGVPNITYTSNGFPSAPTIPSISSVSKNAAFTLTTSNISSADSICYQITAGSKSIYKIVAASQTSYTFPASQMTTLDVTDYGYATVTAYKFNNTTVSGKKYYFINLNTANKSIKVTN